MNNSITMIADSTDDTQGVYMAEDIQRMLNIGRSKTYEYLEEVYRNQQPFRVIKIGKLLRVPRKSFDDFLNSV